MVLKEQESKEKGKMVNRHFFGRHIVHCFYIHYDSLFNIHMTLHKSFVFTISQIEDSFASYPPKTSLSLSPSITDVVHVLPC